MCTFYNHYCSWFETNIKPLHKLQKYVHHVQLPLMAWFPSLDSLFHTCKSNLITSPLPLCYDSSKLAIFKSDWSAIVMGYILIQTDIIKESLKALRHLATTGLCLFVVSLYGPILHPVILGSRYNLPYEVHYPSFVGEIACSRWSIAHNCRYL